MRREMRDLPVPIHRGDRGGGDLEAAAEMQHALGVEIALIAGSIGTHGGAVEHSIVEDARREGGAPTGKGSGLAAISAVTSTEVTATVDSVGP